LCKSGSWLAASADHTGSSKTEPFRLRHGDVVELMDELQQHALKDDWMYGRCERTGICGGFPYDSIYILPTCEKPPPEFMVRASSRGIRHPAHSFIPRLKPSLSANPSHRSLLFLLLD